MGGGEGAERGADWPRRSPSGFPAAGPGAERGADWSARGGAGLGRAMVARGLPRGAGTGSG